MLVKFMNNIINTREIKYINFDKYGLSHLMDGGTCSPLVTIKFTDNEILRIRLRDDDIKEYKKFEDVVLKSNTTK